jgi:hypothetical protein
LYPITTIRETSNNVSVGRNEVWRTEMPFACYGAEPPDARYTQDDPRKGPSQTHSRLNAGASRGRRLKEPDNRPRSEPIPSLGDHPVDIFLQHQALGNEITARRLDGGDVILIRTIAFED